MITNELDTVYILANWLEMNVGLESEESLEIAEALERDFIISATTTPISPTIILSEDWDYQTEEEGGYTPLNGVKKEIFKKEVILNDV